MALAAAIAASVSLGAHRRAGRRPEQQQGEAEGDRGRRHRHADPHRGHRRRRQPARPEPVHRLGRTRSQGFAKYINASRRQLAGRKVVVDFYDSKLNPNETRNAEIQACQNDFAMVGTSAVFLTSVDDMRNCKDQAGAATGIPDIPFVTTALVQQCSDQSFPMAPPQVLCATTRPAPADLPGQRRPRRSTTTRSTARTCTASTSSAATRSRPGTRRSSSGLGQMRAVGIKSDEDFDRPGAATQSEFTPIVQTMKSKQLELRAVHRPVHVHRAPPQGSDAAGRDRR